MSANGAGGETAALSAFGRQWGTAEMFALGRRANENPPKLYTFNPKGFRRDVVEFHPAYHDLMRASIAAGLHASTWTATGKRASPPAEVAPAARYYHEDVGAGRRAPPSRIASESRSLAAECTNEIGANRNRDFFPLPDIPAEPGWPQVEWQDFTVVSPRALPSPPSLRRRADQVIRLRQTALRRTEAELVICRGTPIVFTSPTP